MKWLILLFFATVIFVQIKLKFIKKSNFSEFIEKEFEANSTPKKEIDKHFFYESTIQLNKLNINCSDKYKKLFENLEHIDKSEMIKFNEIYTNTELKLKFGPSSLNRIINSESNYREYFRILNDMSEELIINNKFEIAEYILKYLIEQKSEFSKSYTLLIRLYNENFTYKLPDLIEGFKNNQVLNNNISLKKLVYKSFEVPNEHS